MTEDGAILRTLVVQFLGLSLLAIGGANSAVPEMHRQTVEVHHRLTDRQFSELYAIAQAAPGPNVLIVTLLGQHVAGWAGGLLATFAMCGPTCVFAWAVARVFDRFREARWRMAIQAGLVPVSIGLVAATALILARSADHSWLAVVITAVTFVITYATRISPLVALAGAAIIGFLGLL